MHCNLADIAHLSDSSQVSNLFSNLKLVKVSELQKLLHQHINFVSIALQKVFTAEDLTMRIHGDRESSEEYI